MDKLEELYQNLNNSGYYSASFDEFKEQFSAEESQKALYEAMNGKDMYQDSFDDFQSEFFVEPQAEAVKKKEELVSEESPLVATEDTELESEESDYLLDSANERFKKKEEKWILQQEEKLFTPSEALIEIKSQYYQKNGVDYNEYQGLLDSKLELTSIIDDPEYKKDKYSNKTKLNDVNLQLRMLKDVVNNAEIEYSTDNFYDAIQNYNPSEVSEVLAERGVDQGMVRMEHFLLNGVKSSPYEIQKALFNQEFIDGLQDGTNTIYIAPKMITNTKVGASLNMLYERQLESGGQWGDLLDSFAAGTINLAAGLVNIAEGVGAQASPYQHVMYNIHGGTMASWMKEQADEIMEHTRVYEFDGISESLINGNYGNAFAQFGNGLAQTAPQIIAMYATGGMATAGLTGKALEIASKRASMQSLSLMGASTMGQRDLELKQMRLAGEIDMTDGAILLNSILHGAAEMVFEIPTSKLINSTRLLVGKGLIKEEAIEGLSKNFVKEYFKATGIEAASEMGTELTNLLTDAMTGAPSPESVSDAVLLISDAGILGFGMGGVMASPYLRAAYIKDVRDKIDDMISVVITDSKGNAREMKRAEALSFLRHPANRAKVVDGEFQVDSSQDETVAQIIEEILSGYHSEEAVIARRKVMPILSQINESVKALKALTKAKVKSGEGLDLINKINELVGNLITESESNPSIIDGTFNKSIINAEKALKAKGITIENTIISQDIDATIELVTKKAEKEAKEKFTKETHPDMAKRKAARKEYVAQQLSESFTHENAKEDTDTKTEPSAPFEITNDSQLKSIQDASDSSTPSINIVTSQDSSGLSTSSNKSGKTLLVAPKVNYRTVKQSEYNKAIKDYLNKKKALASKQDANLDVIKVNNKAFTNVKSESLDEVSDKEMKTGGKGKGYHILTSEVEGLNDKNNDSRFEKLKKVLKSKGLKFKVVHSVDNGVSKRALLVKGLSNNQALDLGRGFQQESVFSSKSGVLFADGGIASLDGNVNKSPSARTGDKFFIVKGENGRKYSISMGASEASYGKSFNESSLHQLDPSHKDYDAEFMDSFSKSRQKILGYVLKMLSSIGQLNIVISRNSSSMVKLLVKNGMSVSDAKAHAAAKAFYRTPNKKGTIYLNMARISGNTLFHEIVHPMVSFLKTSKEGRALYDNLESQVKDSNTKRRYLNRNGDKVEETYYEWAERKYAKKVIGLSDGDKHSYFVEEAISEMIGDAALGQIIKGTSTYDKIKDFVNKILSYITGKSVNEELDTLDLAKLESLGDFRDGVARAIINGDEINIGGVPFEVGATDGETKFQASIDKSIVGSLESGDEIITDEVNLDYRYLSERGAKFSLDESKERIDFAESDIPLGSIVELNGQRVYVSPIDKSFTGKVTSKNGIQHIMMGGIAFPMQKGVGGWAFTTRQRAQIVLNKLKKAGISKMVFMVQANEGTLGNLNFIEYINKEIERALEAKEISNSYLMSYLNGRFENKGVINQLNPQGKPKNLLPTEPLNNFGEFIDFINTIGTVDRNFLMGNILGVGFTNKVGLPRKSAILDFVNEPLLEDAKKGDIVGVIDIDVDSPIIETKEGDDGHHVGYNYQVQGSNFKLFEKFASIVDVFPKYKSGVELGKPIEEQRTLKDKGVFAAYSTAQMGQMITEVEVDEDFTGGEAQFSRFSVDGAEVRFDGIEPMGSIGFGSWFRGSTAVNDKGQPIVYYHGTPNIFDKFDKDKLDHKAFYFTPDVHIANQFAADVDNNSNIIPAYIKVENTFDFENPEHVDGLVETLMEQYSVIYKNSNQEQLDLYRAKLTDRIAEGDWRIIEDSIPLLKINGYDSFFVVETGFSGSKNLGIFNGNNARSIYRNDFGNIDSKFQIDNVYHGGPKEITRFDTSFVGENGTAYGWGIYFSDKQSVAKGYRDASLNADTDKIGSLTVGDYYSKLYKSAYSKFGRAELNELKMGFIEMLVNSNNFDLTATEFIFETQDYVAPELMSEVKSWIKDEIKPNYKRGGTIIEATLHEGKEPNEYEYLDLDVEVMEDTAIKVVDQMIEEGLAEESDRDYDISQYTNIKGAQLYGQLESQLGSQKAASEFLLRAGIDGNVYEQAEDEKNYVVFNSESISIKGTKFSLEDDGTLMSPVSNLNIAINSLPNKPKYEKMPPKKWIEALTTSGVKGAADEALAMNLLETLIDYSIGQGVKSISRTDVAIAIEMNSPNVTTKIIDSNYKKLRYNDFTPIISEESLNQLKRFHDNWGFNINNYPPRFELMFRVKTPDGKVSEKEYKKIITGASDVYFLADGNTNLVNRIYSESVWELSVNQFLTDELQMDNLETINQYYSEAFGQNLTNPMYRYVSLKGGNNYREMLFHTGDRYGETHVSHHFGKGSLNKNLIGWVRFNDFVDAQGNKILMINEIQSDWQQAGTSIEESWGGSKGFRRESSEDLETQIDKLLSEKMEAKQEYISLKIAIDEANYNQRQIDITKGLMRLSQAEQLKLNQEAGEGSEELGILADRIGVLQGKIITLKNQSTRIQYTPWNTSKLVSGLAIRSIYKLAIKDGYDYIGFISGQDAVEIEGGEGLSAKQQKGLNQFYENTLPEYAQGQLKRIDKKIKITESSLYKGTTIKPSLLESLSRNSIEFIQGKFINYPINNDAELLKLKENLTFVLEQELESLKETAIFTVLEFNPLPLVASIIPDIVKSEYIREKGFTLDDVNNPSKHLVQTILNDMSPFYLFDVFKEVDSSSEFIERWYNAYEVLNRVVSSHPTEIATINKDTFKAIELTPEVRNKISSKPSTKFQVDEDGYHLTPTQLSRLANSYTDFDKDNDDVVVSDGMIQLNQSSNSFLNIVDPVGVLMTDVSEEGYRNSSTPRMFISLDKNRGISQEVEQELQTGIFPIDRLYPVMSDPIGLKDKAIGNIENFKAQDKREVAVLSFGTTDMEAMSITLQRLSQGFFDIGLDGQVNMSPVKDVDGGLSLEINFPINNNNIKEIIDECCDNISYTEELSDNIEYNQEHEVTKLAKNLGFQGVLNEMGEFPIAEIWAPIQMNQNDRFQLENQDERTIYTHGLLSFSWDVSKKLQDVNYAIGTKLTNSKIISKVPYKAKLTDLLSKPFATHTNKDVKDIMVLSKGSINLELFNASENVKELKRAIKVYNDKVGPKRALDTKRLNELMGSRDAIKRLRDNELKKAFLECRDHLDVLSSILVKEGMVDGPMAIKIDANLGVYVSRRYRKYEKRGWKQQDEAILQKAREWLIGKVQEKNEGLSIEEIEEIAEQDLTLILKGDDSKLIQYSSGFGNTLTRVNSIFKQKNVDLPVELRDLLGEIHDPYFNYINTITKLSRTVASDRMYRSLIDIGEGLFLSAPDATGERPADLNKGFDNKITDKRFGPLEGYFLDNEMFSVLHEMDNSMKRFDNWFYRGYMKTVMFGKKMKTIWSIGTHIRNVGGNTSFMMLNGHLDGKQMFPAAQAALQAVTTFNDSELKELYEKLVRFNVVNSSASLQEIRGISQDLVDSEFDLDVLFDSEDGPLMKRSLANLAKIPLKKLEQLDSFLIKAYQMEDDVFKIYGFLNEKERYMAVGYTEAESEVIAAENVRNTYPNYDEIPRIIRFIGRSPLVGTFVAFNAETIRCTKNSLMIAMREMGSDNSALRLVGTKRLASSLMTVTLVESLQFIVAQALFNLGSDDEVEDKLQRLLVADWDKDGFLLPVGGGVLPNGEGYFDYMNMSKMSGIGYVRDIFRVAISGADSETGKEAITNILKAMYSPFLSEEMTLKAIREARDNDFGRIYNEDAPWYDIIPACLDYVGQKIGPSTAIQGFKIADSMENDSKRVLSYEIAAMLGFRITRVSANTSIRFSMSDTYNKVRNRAKGNKVFQKGNIDVPLLNMEPFNIYDKRAFLERVTKGMPMYDYHLDSFIVEMADLMAAGRANHVPILSTVAIMKETLKIPQHIIDEATRRMWENHRDLVLTSVKK